MAPFLVALIGSGLRLVANAALAKGSEFIKEKTGVDVEQASLSDADKLKLRQFQAEHEEELLRLQLEDNRLGLEETKAYLADVEDARKNQTAVLTDANAPWYAKAIQPALAAFVVLATVLLFGLFVYWSGDVVMKDGTTKSPLNDTQKDIIIYILGVLSAAVTQILGYYFGSSKGSADKTRSLDAALQNSSGANK
ncbi:MAG TPA: hypothetical protein VLC92_08375 [Rhodocyclaceae bacterium]|nr:hypothetical protein [Rhodocyclaceae bacterium]